MNQKLIAGLCSFLITFASINFALVFSIDEADAIPIVEAAAKHTCEETKNGYFCVESEDSSFSEFGGCAGLIHEYTSAANVDACTLGTCVPRDGTQCLTAKSKVECRDLGGYWDPNPSEQVAECKLGCCNVANSLCSLEQQTVCVEGLAGGDATAFNPGIVDAVSCNNECRGAELGACVLTGGVCEFGSRESCTLSGGSFSAPVIGKTIYCKDVVAGIKSHAYITLGSNDVIDDSSLDCYYYDDRGNIEDIAFDCEYPNKLCVDPDGVYGKNGSCQSTACVDEGAATTPAHFLHGESICLQVKDWHYVNEGRSSYISPSILTCQQGIVLVDSTIVERDTVCIDQEGEDGYFNAKMIDNNWEACINKQGKSDCGDNGGIAGITDIFGYLPPPISSFLLAVTGNQPCRGSGLGDDLTVWNGELCKNVGVTDGVRMCGAPLGSDFDNDFWAPVGSCGPAYPPSGTDLCKEACGKGGDGLLNVCTQEECNALGDCQFTPGGNLDETMLAGSMIYMSTCTAAAFLAQSIGIPVLREGGLVASAEFCAGLGGGNGLYAAGASLAVVGGLTTIGYLSARSPTSGEAIAVDIEDGQAKLTDVLLAERVIETETGESIDSLLLGDLAASFIAADGALYGDELANFLGRMFTFNQVKGFGYGSEYALGVSSAGEEAVRKAAEEAYTTSLGEGLMPDPDYLSSIGDEAVSKWKESHLTLGDEATKIIGVSGALLSAWSVGKSLNAGECKAEQPYTNNNNCGQCGIGDGSWFCTYERCGVLGAWVPSGEKTKESAMDNLGQCRWVIDEDSAENDGSCLPLQPSDALPPQVTTIKATFYDNNDVPVLTSNGGSSLDVPGLVPWNAILVTAELTTNDPAFCKYSKGPGVAFSDMAAFNSSEYTTTHTTTVELTSNDKVSPDFRLYFKCEDINGNAIGHENSFLKADFEPIPDSQPPEIKHVTPNGGFIPENVLSTTLKLRVFDTTDVSECRFGNSETKNFEEMTGTFTKGLSKVACGDTLLENDCWEFESESIDLTTTDGTIDVPNTDDDLKFKIINVKCTDNQNNVMLEPYQVSLTIVPAPDLGIEYPAEGEEVWSTTLDIIVNTTSISLCTYSLDGSSGVNMTTEGGIRHNATFEPLTVSQPGTSHTLAVTCEDIVAGNEVSKTVTFKAFEDVKPPEVRKIYTEGNFLNLLLSEKSSCEYSTETSGFIFNTGEGTLMVASDEGTLHRAGLSKEEAVYYIKCRDEFTNELTLTVYP